MLIKADLHMHSNQSDGKASPLEVLRVAWEKGLGAISITDHDVFTGSLIAMRYSREYGLVVIPGIEVRTDHGDILVYCRDSIDIPRRLGELVDRAHVENCLVVPAHPFDVFRLGIGDLIYEYRDWDAIEVWNASSTRNSNYRAIEAAKILGKPGLSNSDAHLPEEIGSAYTIIEIGELSLEEILEAIRKGRVKPVFKNTSTRSRFNRILWSLERKVRDVFKPYS